MPKKTEKVDKPDVDENLSDETIPEIKPEVEKKTKTEKAEKAERDPLILKVSELKKLSDDEQQKFRQAGGTAIEG